MSNEFSQISPVGKEGRKKTDLAAHTPNRLNQPGARARFSSRSRPRWPVSCCKNVALQGSLAALQFRETCLCGTETTMGTAAGDEGTTRPPFLPKDKVKAPRTPNQTSSMDEETGGRCGGGKRAVFFP